MSCFTSVQDDINNNLFADFGWLQMGLLALLLVLLAVTLFSNRIAQRFKNKEEEVMGLSVKIKTGALIVVAVLALIITQFG